MKKIARLVTVISLMVVSACLFGSDDDDQYEDRIEHKYKVVTG